MGEEKLASISFKIFLFLPLLERAETHRGLAGGRKVTEPEVAMFPFGMQLHFPNTEGFFTREPSFSSLFCSQVAWKNARLIPNGAQSTCFNSIDINLIKRTWAFPLFSSH